MLSFGRESPRVGLTQALAERHLCSDDRNVLRVSAPQRWVTIAAATLGLGEGLNPMQLLCINIVVLPGIGLASKEPNDAPYTQERISIRRISRSSATSRF